VLDGNFKLAHVKQKRPEDDVWLSDGHGMMANQSRYIVHLNTALEEKEVRCSYIIQHTTYYPRAALVVHIGQSYTNRWIMEDVILLEAEQPCVPGMVHLHLAAFRTSRRVNGKHLECQRNLRMIISLQADEYGLHIVSSLAKY
jgi:hypothetical protein